MDLKLGILYKDGRIVNHRSLLKVFINPILRYFGCCIASICDKEKVIGIKIVKCKRQNIQYDFNSYNDYDIIIKERTIF